MISILGIISASAAPAAMSFGFIIWGESWKGSAFSLNLFKCTLASLIFLVIGFSVRIPSIGGFDALMLILSSLLGIVIGDNTWLLALQMIGARKVIVVDASKPFLAAILGYFILNEPLYISTAVGIAITIIGIAIVSLETSQESVEQSQNDLPSSATTTTTTVPSIMTSPPLSADVVTCWDDADVEGDFDDVSVESDIGDSFAARCTPSTTTLGYFFAFLNVLFDSYGFVLTKQHGLSLNTFEINLIRFGFAAAVMIAISALHLLRDKIFRSYLHPKHSISSIQNYTFSPLPDESNHGEEDDVSNEFVSERVANPKMKNFEIDSIDSYPNKDTFVKQSSVWYMLPHMSMCNWAQVVIGILFVTFLCPALSNYALFELDLGLCMTLTSLGPIYSLPLVYFMRGERVTIRATIGSLLAVVGISVMFYGQQVE